jgi:hypothetical protein
MSLFGGNITSSVHAAMKDQHATELAETVGPGVVLGLALERKRLIKRVNLFWWCAPRFKGANECNRDFSPIDKRLPQSGVITLTDAFSIRRKMLS